MTYAGKPQREARARAAAKLPSPCPRCGGIVTETMNWHADHWPVSRAEAKRAGIPLEDLDVYPAHASCNEAANDRYPRRRSSARPRGARGVVRPAIGA